MDRWHARDPDPLESSLLAEFLMDLTVDPFGSGEEDGETGVWNGRVAPFILVICTIDREKNSVHVAGIDYG